MSRRYQQDGRGTEQHFSLSKNRIRRGWNREDRTDAPDQFARMGGRHKELLSNVANSIRVAVRYRIRLTDHRHDGARDQVPVCVDVQRHDRLNVKHSWVRLNGPALKFVLLWNGRLTRSAIGFCDCFAKSSSAGFAERAAARVCSTASE